MRGLQLAGHELFVALCYSHPARSVTTGSPAWSWSRHPHAARSCAGQVDGRHNGGRVARSCTVRLAWSVPAPGLQLAAGLPVWLTCHGKGAGIRTMSGAWRSVRE